jgi:hypothetical protein
MDLFKKRCLADNTIHDANVSCPACAKRGRERAAEKELTKWIPGTPEREMFSCKGPGCQRPLILPDSWCPECWKKAPGVVWGPSGERTITPPRGDLPNSNGIRILPSKDVPRDMGMYLGSQAQSEFSQLNSEWLAVSPTKQAQRRIAVFCGERPKTADDDPPKHSVFLAWLEYQEDTGKYGGTATFTGTMDWARVYEVRDNKVTRIADFSIGHDYDSDLKVPSKFICAGTALVFGLHGLDLSGSREKRCVYCNFLPPASEQGFCLKCLQMARHVPDALHPSQDPARETGTSSAPPAAEPCSCCWCDMGRPASSTAER